MPVWYSDMKMRVDLHTHTTASDGQYTPEQLVEKAGAAGIQVLAVTDHDTLDGVEEAVQAGRRLGVAVLRGIELGAREHRYMHILGLGLSTDCPELSTLCQTLRASRDERAHRIIAFLREKGIDLDLAEVEALAGGQVIARPHFAQVMVQHGYVSSPREAFDRYLDTDEYQKIERYKAPAADCIRAIHQGGGKAVLAHPYQLGFSVEKLEYTIQMLKDQGLDGLECWYPFHTAEMTQQYLELAKRYGLGVTAGSDFHGEQVKPGILLQPILLDISWLDNRSKEGDG